MRLKQFDSKQQYRNNAFSLQYQAKEVLFCAIMTRQYIRLIQTSKWCILRKMIHTNSAITNKKTYHKDDIDWSEFGSHWLSIARQFSEYNKTTFWVEHMEFVQNVTPNSHYPNRNECKQRLDTVKWVRLMADYDFKSIWFERSIWSLNHQTNRDHIFNISISNSIKKWPYFFLFLLEFEN